MSKNNVDVIVIGAGSGGLNVASFFARIKMRVVLIDKYEQSIGGDCLNTGCVPSKALIHAASSIRRAHDVKEYGLTTEGHVDIQKVMRRIHDKQSIIRAHESSDYLKTKGIDVRLGAAIFTSPSTVTINGEEIAFKKCILATGSHARELKIANDNSVPHFNNESIFNIDFLPKEFVFIGGGPISCELGQAFARLGSHVTILNQQERILPKEDKDVSGVVIERFEEDGVTIINNATVVEIREKKVWYIVDGNDEIKSVQADALFVGIGRVLNIEGLDIEKAGIKRDQSGQKLEINTYLQTTNKNVYTVGDVAGSFMFTHAAEEHVKAVISNMLSPFKKKIGNVMHWVTFTDPQVATFGNNVTDIKKAGIEYEVLEVSFAEEDRAITDDERVGFARVYLDTRLWRKGRVLGGTVVGADAGELVQELILLYHTRLPLSVLYNKIYPYPVKSRINRRLASLYLSKKLSEKNGGILRLLFKVFSSSLTLY